MIAVVVPPARYSIRAASPVRRSLILLLLVCAVLSPDHSRAYHTSGRPREAAGLATAVVADLGPAARCSRLVAAGDDLYVVDRGAEHVRRYILHGLPYALQMTQVMRWREGDNGLIMGRPLDLFLAGERLLMLDSLGSLWSYWGPGYARAVVPLRLQRNQGAPSAVALHGADLLLLDDDKRQVWEYAPAPGRGYDSPPRPLLATALPGAPGVRLAVTARALLIARSDGTVTAVPWGQSRGGAWRVPLTVTGLWADGAHRDVLIATARELAVVAADGAVRWRAPVRGLGAETVRDVARSPSGRLYLLTDTRILIVRNPVPAL